MNFKVDQDECIGCEAYESICPEVFRLEDGKSKVIITPVTEKHQSVALEAKEGCPVSAISHE